MRQVVDSITNGNTVSQVLVGDWTIREVLVHIAGWYREYIREIDGILRNRPILSPKTDDIFNRQLLDTNKGRPLEEVIREWDHSYNALISRVSQLTNDDWNHVCAGQIGKDGKEVSMKSLFADLSGGVSHEGKHAAEIMQMIPS